MTWNFCILLESLSHYLQYNIFSGDSVKKYVRNSRLIEMGFRRALSIEQPLVSLRPTLGGLGATVFRQLWALSRFNYKILCFKIMIYSWLFNLFNLTWLPSWSFQLLIMTSSVSKERQETGSHRFKIKPLLYSRHFIIWHSIVLTIHIIWHATRQYPAMKIFCVRQTLMKTHVSCFACPCESQIFVLFFLDNYLYCF